MVSFEILDLSSFVWKSEIDSDVKDPKILNLPFFDELRHWTLKYNRLCRDRDDIQKQDLKSQVTCRQGAVLLFAWWLDPHGC